MNTDVKDLLGRIKVNDPSSLMAFGGLVVATIALILVLTGGVRAFVMQRNLRTEYRTVTGAIDSMMSAQQDTPASLQARLDEQQAQLDGLLASFPTETEVNDEVTRFYQYASYYGARLVSVDWGGKAPVAEESPVSVEPISLTLSGRVDDLLSFVKHVADGPLDTLIITNVSITPADPSTASILIEAYYVPPREGELDVDAPVSAPTPIPVLTLEATPSSP